MARVFHGVDRALERPVAIKVLRPELASAVGSERFVREAKRLANLHHPHLVAVHEAGEADGLFYYVMDLIEAETLQAMIERGPLPVDQALPIGIGLLEALEVVHEHGIVHRDVKPENIFIQGTHPLLADFGIAKSIDRDSQALTKVGAFMGTPAYMSPEQAQGRSVTPAADLYSTGQVLYACLTGRNWRLGAGRDDADWAGVPREVRPALMRALEPVPEHRWGSAAEFREALSSIRRTGGAPLGRRRWPWAVAGSGVAAALAAWLYWPPPSSAQIRTVAVARCADASPAAEIRTVAVANALHEVLVKALQNQGVGVTAYDSAYPVGAGPPADAIAGSLGVDAVMLCSSDLRGSRIAAAASLADGADGDSLWARSFAAEVTNQVTLWGQIDGQLAEWFGRAPATPPGARTEFSEEAVEQGWLARLAWSRRTEDPGRLLEARDHYEAALRIEPGFASALAGLAEVWIALPGRGLESAAVAFDTARSLARRAIALDGDRPGPYAVLGEAIRAHRWEDWADAADYFEEAIARDSTYATARLWYALWLIADGQPERAIEQAERAVQIEEDAGIATGLGQILYLAGEARAAVPQLEHTVRRWGIAWEAQLWLVAALIESEAFEEARARLATASDLAPAQAAPLLATAHALLGDTTRARALLDPEARVSPFWLAAAHEALGGRERALELLSTAELVRDEFLTILEVLPPLDSLRADPRSASMRRRLPWSRGR